MSSAIWLTSSPNAKFLIHVDLPATGHSHVLDLSGINSYLFVGEICLLPTCLAGIIPVLAAALVEKDKKLMLLCPTWNSTPGDRTAPRDSVPLPGQHC